MHHLGDRGKPWSCCIGAQPPKAIIARVLIFFSLEVRCVLDAWFGFGGAFGGQKKESVFLNTFLKRCGL
jgi:hypothetical protein